MELRINIVEASAGLAEESTKEEMMRNLDILEEDLDSVMYQVDEESGDTIYTDTAQEIFNNYYDHYFSVLLACATEEVVAQL